MTTATKRRRKPAFRPCPFCGSNKPTVVQEGIDYVRCEGCKAEGPPARTASRARRAWNVRCPLE